MGRDDRARSYPNSGSLFKNTRGRSDNSPDYTGKCEVDGVDFYISAWVKGGRDGKAKFFSLSFTPVKDDRRDDRDDRDHDRGRDDRSRDRDRGRDRDIASGGRDRDRRDDDRGRDRDDRGRGRDDGRSDTKDLLDDPAPAREEPRGRSAADLDDEIPF